MTLYDLLGALPNDDAEGLRTAFRRAVKGAHPDLRPGDPDAALKFREIVRAHEILGDAEQRAAYDHLLDLAHLEQASANGHAAAARIHKLASGVIALAGVSVAAAGGYLLFAHVSAASVAPADRMTPAMHASISADPPPVTTASLASDDGTGKAAEAGGPNISIPKTSAENTPAANAGVTPVAATGDARPVRARGGLTHRNGLPGPKMAVSGDRGIILQRLRRFERAFADVPPDQAERSSERPGRAKSASATAGSSRPGPTPVARPVPVPRPRTIVPDPSRQENMASAR